MASKILVQWTAVQKTSVAVTPMTLLAAVVENARAQLKLPADGEYGLVYQRKKLDLTLPVRFANLPANVKLELVRTGDASNTTAVPITTTTNSSTAIHSTTLSQDAPKSTSEQQPKIATTSTTPTPTLNTHSTEPEKVHATEKQAAQSETTNEESRLDRQLQIFKPPQSNSPAASKIQLPDSHFSLTPAEMKVAMAMAKAKREALENQPLMTRAMREKETEKKRNMYPKTMIRVRFPDMYQLQAIFLSQEKVSDIIDFVREHIADANTRFRLYITPPKTILNLDDDLFTAQLAPASVVYFQPEVPKQGMYLKQEFVQIAQDLSVPDQNSSVIESETGRGSEDRTPSPAPPPRSADSSHQPTEPSGSSPSLASKVPKWFKLGMKK